MPSTLQDSPYHYIGYPFAGHSIMAIEVTLYWPGPVEIVYGKLKLYQPINSSALRRSIEEFNAGRFDTAAVLLKGIRKPEAQVANKAVVGLWLSGRLGTAFLFTRTCFGPLS